MPSIKAKSKLALFTLATSLTLAGCNNMVTIPAPDTQPLESHSETTPTQTQHGAISCPTFDPAEHKMCTMQFDPVCVKERSADGSISYRTAGNACSACNSAVAISYTPGQCQ